MKKPSREINIFSMSALDLFASALGAFILITVILFPYFPNTGDSVERVAEVRAQLQLAQQQLREQQERRRFLLILISWGKEDDVDLHVVDPQGREFYYQQKTHAGTPAKLEEDNVRGPGNEIWLHPQTLPGEYKVYYKLFGQRSSSVTVRGSMLTPDGRTALPERRLSVEGRKVLVAMIRVDDQGNMTLNSL